ncbi:DNA-binding protein [Lutibacter sp. HS1-25]|uniref:helix-turn-helix domain-containing protein n=1 Tax=Lutibacter sp. HS1-25 TaxID=2485000 RepID=UPI0010124156|nr:helix-turn-helix domain-containing protein [Lutibacter sp. HS1-25]RXP54562.1 DNA-binding protein [Lutibacter sp. HS1-25]
MSSNLHIPKTCDYCGKAFIARTTVTKCCSDSCSKRAYKARKRQDKIQTTIEGEIQKNKSNKSENIAPAISLNSKDFLSITDASQLIDVSRWTIQRMIKRGQLNAVQFGNKHIIKRSQIENLFN